MGWETGYWNGLETKVRKVKGVVKDWEEGVDPPKAWWRDIVGETVNAVEVILDGVNFGGGHTFLFEGIATMPAVPELDIEEEVINCNPWYKVTEGKGSPRFGHCDVRLIPETVKDR